MMILIRKDLVRVFNKVKNQLKILKTYQKVKKDYSMK